MRSIYRATVDYLLNNAPDECPPQILNRIFGTYRAQWVVWTDFSEAARFGCDIEGALESLLREIQQAESIGWIAVSDWDVEEIEPDAFYAWREVAATASTSKCPDCNGTGVYRGLLTEEPCRACQLSQES